MTSALKVAGLVAGGMLVTAPAAFAPPSPDAVPTVRSNATVGMDIGSAGAQNENVTIRMEVVNGTVTYVVTSQRGLTPLEGCQAAGNDPTSGHPQARCQRVDPRVSAQFASGTDTFAATGAFTDPILYVNTGGNDTASGGAADDVFLGANTGAETFNGRNGNDKLVGRDGADVLDGGDGNDRLEGGPGDDIVKDSEFSTSGTSFPDTLLGEDGNDQVIAGGGEDTMDGGNGDDRLVDGGALAQRDTARGGAGRDTLTISSSGFELALSGPASGQDGAQVLSSNVTASGIETLVGSNGGDVFRAGINPTTAAIDLRGESGNDQITGTAGRNVITGGAGTDTLNGADGDDIVDAKGGESSATADTIDCGGGAADLAVVDLTDAVTKSCDGNVDRSAIGERPHIVLSVKRSLRVRAGRLTVPLSCPRAVRHTCAGTLQVATSESLLASAPRTRYSVPAGRSATVRVRARAGLALRGRRVQLRSTERGDVKGAKTTLRRAVVR